MDLPVQIVRGLHSAAPSQLSSKFGRYQDLKAKFERFQDLEVIFRLTKLKIWENMLF